MGTDWPGNCDWGSCCNYYCPMVTGPYAQGGHWASISGRPTFIVRWQPIPLRIRSGNIKVKFQHLWSTKPLSHHFKNKFYRADELVRSMCEEAKSKWQEILGKCWVSGVDNDCRQGLSQVTVVSPWVCQTWIIWSARNSELAVCIIRPLCMARCIRSWTSALSSLPTHRRAYVGSDRK